jgi:RimJ/RimL family protein N-acetyltransferase
MSEITPTEHELKTGERLVIRTAVPDDAEALLENTRMILGEGLFYIREADEFEMSVEEEREWIQQRLDNPAQIIIVAEVGGFIVGMLDLKNRDRRKLAHVGSLGIMILPEFRNKGVGTALLKSVIKWAEENPVIEKITLGVFATNETAISLYEKMGFEQEGREIRAIKTADGTYVDTILMYRFV